MPRNAVARPVSSPLAPSLAARIAAVRAASSVAGSKAGAISRGQEKAQGATRDVGDSTVNVLAVETDLGSGDGTGVGTAIPPEPIGHGGSFDGGGASGDWAAGD
ncbi:hypothetical protein ACU4GI_46895 (plasmid) [Cupriavidus basilensis]